MLLKHGERFRLLEPQPEEVRLLEMLTTDRRRCVDALTSLGQELQAVLKMYYPQMLDLLGGELTTTLACKLVLKYPTLEKLSRARANTLRAFFYAHNFRRPDQLEKRLAACRKPQPLTTDAALITGCALRACRLAKEILALLPYIKEYEARIAKCFKSHEDAFIFESLPGAGSALAPRLLVCMGSERSRWNSALEVATTSGIAPVRAQSGSSSKVTWRWACPKFQRQSFHEFANASRSFAPWARCFYQTQRQRGKSHHAAVRSLAFKWTRIIFRCWKDRVAYDPLKYPPQRSISQDQNPPPKCTSAT